MALRLLALVWAQTPRWSGSPRPGVYVHVSGGVSPEAGRPVAGLSVRAMDIGLLINLLLPVCPLSLVF